ncbi:hypothetical protein [Halococcus saccharolyticus]|uniref:Uncharacterized protein n=1 Tax=Halococcus saccharolyticus DSM 5350 TaxID=1227455 RepID=M0MPQ6_9EURY|nr:hypothetical protein [Halococcus saccharolyticus]EMA47621.1 hypothetical protein C449_01122 [Halococcus saccharolyticus DSM 5350]
MSDEPLYAPDEPRISEDPVKHIEDAIRSLKIARSQGVGFEHFVEGGQADLTLAAAQANIEQVAEELDE